MARDSFLKTAAPLVALTFLGVYNLPSQSNEEPAALATAAPAGPRWSSEDNNDVSVQYGDCDEVRAAGKAPLYRGDPGYGEHMDGDSDGIACEPHYGN